MGDTMSYGTAYRPAAGNNMTKTGDLDTPDYGEGQRSPLPTTSPAAASVMGLSRRSFLDMSLASVAGLVLVLRVRAATASSANRVGGSARPSDGLTFLSVEEASALVKSKKVSPVELTRACLARIEALNPSLNAFITVTAESALAEAQRAESEVQHGGWRGPLHGIPIALKDLIDTAGVKTTAASALFKDRIPQEDATVVRRLKDAGAVLLGKLNMHEFAYGGTSVPSFYGRVSNPWNVERIAGGSSGGPAAAVAAGLCYAALGSDTGGSIRQPAAFCGIVGLKPTYGRVSNRGVIPLAWSLDHIGPMTRSVADAAIVLQVIAGYDPDETSSQDRPVGRYLESMRQNRGRLRVGVPREFFFANLDPEIQATFDQALAVLVRIGAETRDVPLEVSKDRTVIRAEAYAYHAEYMAKTPELYIPETLGKLKLGAAIDGQSYIRARRDLDRLRRSTLNVFSSVDLLVTPTTPVSPPKASDYPATLDGALALDGLVLRNTRPFNMYGFPTISVPCGMTNDGLPIGLQISGPPWEEQRVLGLARAFEEVTDWHKRRPPALASM
jgi:aspartyl-tRNA(Asn)/glutamyl-tRNA(Gln) amidotransferase subunit A